MTSSIQDFQQLASKKYDVMALIEEHEEAVAKHKKRKAKKKRK